MPQLLIWPQWILPLITHFYFALLIILFYYSLFLLLIILLFYFLFFFTFFITHYFILFCIRIVGIDQLTNLTECWYVPLLYIKRATPILSLSIFPYWEHVLLRNFLKKGMLLTVPQKKCHHDMTGICYQPFWTTLQTNFPDWLLNIMRDTELESFI